MDKYKVTLTGKEKTVEAFNALRAALTAYPELFKYRYIHEMSLKPIKENHWVIQMHSGIMFVRLDITLLDQLKEN